MGVLDDGSTKHKEDEDALLQLPIVELDPEEAAHAKADHFFKIPEAKRDIADEIDWSLPRSGK